MRSARLFLFDTVDFSKVKQVQDGQWFVVWPTQFAAPGRKLLAP